MSAAPLTTADVFSLRADDQFGDRPVVRSADFLGCTAAETADQRRAIILEQLIAEAGIERHPRIVGLELVVVIVVVDEPGPSDCWKNLSNRTSSSALWPL